MPLRAITRDTVEKAYRRVADLAQPPSDEEALGAKLTVLNDLIMQDLLAAKARALQIEVPDSEVEAAVAEARKNVPNDAFEQELARRNLTQADVRESLRRDLLSQRVMSGRSRRRSAWRIRRSRLSSMPTGRSLISRRTPTASPRS
jgi:hypothetical protein